MRRWNLAAIAILLVPLSVVLMRTSPSQSQEQPSENAPKQTPANKQPQAPATLPGVAWNDFLSAENLQGEMTKTRDHLKGTLATVGTYNSNYKTISIDGTVIAALAGIAIEHPGKFDWKPNAALIRDAGRELAEASTGLGREKYEVTKAAFDKLESAFRGNVPADAPKPRPRRSFDETVLRANAMKRIEIAKNNLRDTITNAAMLKTRQEAISRDSQLIAALGKIIATDGYPSADEQDYQEFAADLVGSIQDVSTASTDLHFEKFTAAMTRLSKSCDQCHANYGNDELTDLIANRLKRKIDIDFKRTPLQEAFAFISSEINTKIAIDGDALKAGGFTKNMPQTFQGEMTVLAAIETILEKYQDPNKPSQTMVIVVDEDKKTILVSTKGFCEQQKLTPYEVFKKTSAATGGVGTLKVLSALPWHDFLSAANLQGEMERIRDRLKAALQGPGTYNSNYKTISVDGTVVAALAGIAIEHRGEFDWKANAALIRDVGFELAEASTGLGLEKYAKSKAALNKLESAFSGTIPVDAPKPKPRRPFDETVSRANAMKRIEIAKNNLRDTIKNAAMLKTKQEAVSRESQLIAVLGRIIANEAYFGADEEDYQEYAAALVNGIQDVSEAAKDLSLPKFEIAMARVNKSCDQCHANYGADEVPDRIADRLKRKIDVDFKRTPMQDAFAFISDEIKTPITIDGDALKAGGFTKNMVQTFQGDMTVLDAIAKILEKYQDPNKPSQTMVIVVDEDKQTILVSTKAFCEQQKLTPYEVFKNPATTIPAATGGVGTLKGRVIFEGAFTPLPPLYAQGAATRDPVVCGAQAIPDESILVKDGGLANVFIYLEKAPEGGKSAFFKGAVAFDRKNCLFVPHAMVVLTNQTVSVLNDDPLVHNVHTFPLQSPAFNMVILPNDRVGAKLIYTVAEKQPLSVSCDIHSWMRAYHLPLDHSFADVSKADGAFEIKDLPVGTHEFKVWHEVGKMLEKELAVTIKPGENEITIKIPAAKLAK